MKVKPLVRVEFQYGLPFQDDSDWHIILLWYNLIRSKQDKTWNGLLLSYLRLKITKRFPSTFYSRIFLTFWTMPLRIDVNAMIRIIRSRTTAFGCNIFVKVNDGIYMEVGKNGISKGFRFCIG